MSKRETAVEDIQHNSNSPLKDTMKNLGLKSKLEVALQPGDNENRFRNKAGAAAEPIDSTT